MANTPRASGVATQNPDVAEVQSNSGLGSTIAQPPTIGPLPSSPQTSFVGDSPPAPRSADATTTIGPLPTPAQPSADTRVNPSDLANSLEPIQPDNLIQLDLQPDASELLKVTLTLQKLLKPRSGSGGSIWGEQEVTLPIEKHGDQRIKTIDNETYTPAVRRQKPGADYLCALDLLGCFVQLVETALLFPNLPEGFARVIGPPQLLYQMAENPKNRAVGLDQQYLEMSKAWEDLIARYQWFRGQLSQMLPPEEVEKIETAVGVEAAVVAAAQEVKDGSEVVAVAAASPGGDSVGSGDTDGFSAAEAATEAAPEATTEQPAEPPEKTTEKPVQEKEVVEPEKLEEPELLQEQPIPPAESAETLAQTADELTTATTTDDQSAIELEVTDSAQGDDEVDYGPLFYAELAKAQAETDPQKRASKIHQLRRYGLTGLVDGGLLLERVDATNPSNLPLDAYLRTKLASTRDRMRVLDQLSWIQAGLLADLFPDFIGKFEQLDPVILREINAMVRATLLKLTPAELRELVANPVFRILLMRKTELVNATRLTILSKGTFSATAVLPRSDLIEKYADEMTQLVQAHAVLSGKSMTFSQARMEAVNFLSRRTADELKALELNPSIRRKVYALYQGKTPDDLLLGNLSRLVSGTDIPNVQIHANAWIENALKDGNAQQLSAFVLRLSTRDAQTVFQLGTTLNPEQFLRFKQVIAAYVTAKLVEVGVTTQVVTGGTGAGGVPPGQFVASTGVQATSAATTSGTTVATSDTRLVENLVTLVGGAAASPAQAQAAAWFNQAVSVGGVDGLNAAIEHLSPVAAQRIFGVGGALSPQEFSRFKQVMAAYVTAKLVEVGVATQVMAPATGIVSVGGTTTQAATAHFRAPIQLPSPEKLAAEQSKDELTEALEKKDPSLRHQKIQSYLKNYANSWYKLSVPEQLAVYVAVGITPPRNYCSQTRPIASLPFVIGWVELEAQRQTPQFERLVKIIDKYPQLLLQHNYRMRLANELVAQTPAPTSVSTSGGDTTVGQPEIIALLQQDLYDQYVQLALMQEEMSDEQIALVAAAVGLSAAQYQDALSAAILDGPAGAQFTDVLPVQVAAQDAPGEVDTQFSNSQPTLEQIPAMASGGNEKAEQQLQQKAGGISGTSPVERLAKLKAMMQVAKAASVGGPVAAAAMAAKMAITKLVTDKKFREQVVKFATIPAGVIINLLGMPLAGAGLIVGGFLGGPAGALVGLGAGAALQAALPGMPRFFSANTALGMGEAGGAGAATGTAAGQAAGGMAPVTASAAATGGVATSPTGAASATGAPIAAGATAGAAAAAAAGSSLLGVAAYPLYAFAFIAGMTGMVFLVIWSAFLAPAPTTPTSTYAPGGGQEQPGAKYVTVTKTATPNQIKNDENQPITYQVIVTPKAGYKIVITGLTDTFQGFGASQPNPLPSSPLTFDSLKSTQPELTTASFDTPQTIPYPTTVSLAGFKDAFVSNEVTINFDVFDPATNEPLPDITTQTYTASTYVIVGTPKMGCWPTSGVILSLPFSGIPTHVNSDSFDISDPNQQIGEPIYAPFPGQACGYNTGYHGGYGRHVRLTVPGTFVGLAYDIELLFAHMSALGSVAPCGSSRTDVKPGDIIGYMGSDGNSDGPHLHYELVSNVRHAQFSGSLLRMLTPGGLGIKKYDSVDSNLCKP